MKNITWIFKRDLKRLFTNWVAVIVVIGVCIIPSLYAWFNIDANMDPYSNTQGIRIAVASCDLGTDNELTGSLNAGDRIVENLKENDALGWTFVDKEEALEGVRAGRYYAAIVIPEDFSESLVSVLSDDIESPEIEYYLNEKKNAIAPKVTDTGATTIQQEVNETFVSVAAEAIAEMLESSAWSAKGGVKRLEDASVADIKEVRQALAAQTAVLSKFSKSLGHSEPLIDSGHETLEQLRLTAQQGAETLEDSVDTLEDLRKSVSQFTFAASGVMADVSATLGRIDMEAGRELAELYQNALLLQGDVNAAASSARKVLAANQKAVAELKEIQQKYPDHAGEALSSLISKMEAQNQKYETALNKVESAAARLADTTKDMASLHDQISETVKSSQGNLAEAKKNYEAGVLPGLNKSLDTIALHAGRLAGALTAVGPAIEQMDGILDQIETCLRQVETSMGKVESALDKVDQGLEKAETDLLALESAASYGGLSELLDGKGIDEAEVASFISSPVNLTTESLYPVKNYGSAMTPFYTNLAIWVSGIVLIAIFRMEVDQDERLRRRNLTATQAYFGRWLLFVTVGLVQALIICVGDVCLLGTQCEHAAAFLGAGLLISFVYINLIYALSITFKHIGKALCVLLVILQIPGSAGTYPIEMTPDFFQRLHPLLPFTYGVNAMREAAFGMYHSDYWQYMGVLTLFLPVAFLIGLGIRPLMLNLNRMFDVKLEETGLMICEEEGMTRERLALSTAMEILAGQDAFREMIYKKEESFEANYPKRTRRGFLMILLLPLVFLILMFSVSSKMVFLILWIVSIVAVSLYLIILEFIHESLRRKRRFAEESRETILDAVLKRARRTAERVSERAEAAAERIIEQAEDAAARMTERAEETAGHLARALEPEPDIKAPSEAETRQEDRELPEAKTRREDREPPEAEIRHENGESPEAETRREDREPPEAGPRTDEEQEVRS